MSLRKLVQRLPVVGNWNLMTALMFVEMDLANGWRSPRDGEQFIPPPTRDELDQRFVEYADLSVEEIQEHADVIAPRLGSLRTTVHCA